jgi:hypothetical protein
VLRVGFVGPQTFGYHEDKEFGFRCEEAGLVGVFDRSLVAHHEPTRPFREFLRLAHQQGRDIVALHRAAPERCALDDSDIGRDLPAPARIAVRAATMPLLGALELKALTLVVRALRAPSAQRAQIGAAVVARDVARRRGFREALRVSE